MSESLNDHAGGFLPSDGLPSPAPSSPSSRQASSLPHPRSRSLQPGSNKEDMVRRYVEDQLLNASRRYVKKFSSGEPTGDIVGYKSFSEVCKDLDNLVNVLWLSGTPSLQIPFLLRLASDFTQYVRSFPPAPNATFELLAKLDHCFSSLLTGKDTATGEHLPGFENGLRAGMSTTDMVRCRSLVEQTRVLMVEVMSGVPEDEDDDMGDDEEQTDTETDVAGATTKSLRWDNMDDDRMHLDAARIYEHTIVLLNERLGDPLGARNMSAD